MLHKHFIYALSLFLLAGITQSCDDGQNIGEDLRPTDLGVELLYVDTFTIKAETILLDSFNTLNISQVLVGDYTHSMLGRSQATAYMQLLPSSILDTLVLTPDDAKSEAVYDSITFSIGFDYAYGENSANAMAEFGLYELAEAIDTLGNNSYFYTDTVEKGALLSQFEVDFSGGPEQYSGRLDDAFGMRLFNKVGDGSIANRELFEKEFRGIALTPKNVNGMYAVGISTGETLIRIHYHFTDKDSETFNATLTLLPSLRFHHVSTDRSATPLAALNYDHPIDAADLGYQSFIQAGTGVATRLIIPDMSAFSKANKRIVSRAQLLIVPVEGTLSTSSPAPGTLYFLENEADGRPLINQDGTSSFVNNILGSPLGLSYVANGQSYPVLNITSYIEELANGEAENNGITIFPIETGINTLNTLQIGDSRFPETPLKLYIYYTQFQ